MNGDVFQWMLDQVARLLESQVRVRQGRQGSVVILKVMTAGVKVFETYPSKDNRENHGWKGRNTELNEEE